MGSSNPDYIGDPDWPSDYSAARCLLGRGGASPIACLGVGVGIGVSGGSVSGGAGSVSGTTRYGRHAVWSTESGVSGVRFRDTGVLPGLCVGGCYWLCGLEVCVCPVPLPPSSSSIFC